MPGMIPDLTAYGGLFLTAMAAGSILPVQSEAILVGMMLLDEWSVWLLILVAGLGNTAGSVINWQMGRTLEHYKDRKWFPASAAQLERAHRWYDKYGRASLLLSWVPLFGDGLTVIAGVMEEKLSVFTAIVFAGKLSRYIVLAYLTLTAQSFW